MDKTTKPWQEKPHVTIETPEAVHVFPVVYFERFAKGENVEPIPADVVKVIVSEWLKTLPKGG